MYVCMYLFAIDRYRFFRWIIQNYVETVPFRKISTLDEIATFYPVAIIDVWQGLWKVSVR